MTQPTPPLGSVERLAKERKDGCPICAAYARLRGPRIKAEIRKTTAQRDRAAAWARFMAGVHQRHLAPGHITRRTPIVALQDVPCTNCDDAHPVDVSCSANARDLEETR